MDYEHLKRRLIFELDAMIRQQAEDPLSAVYLVQPPNGVIQLASEVTADLLLAFNLGYQMANSSGDEPTT